MEMIEISVEESLRADAQQVLQREGVTLPEAVSMFLRTVVHDGALPLDYRKPNAATLSAMKDAADGRMHEASSVEDLMRSLHHEN